LTVVQTSRGWLLFGAILLLVVFGLVAAVMYWRIARFHEGGGSVHYVLPDGFRGRIKVVFDSRCAPISEDQRAMTLTVPPDGVVRVADVSWLHEWRTVSASYADGTTIPMDITGTVPQLVALRDAGGGWCIGTYKDCVDTLP
jgi:hypothetical protein